MSSTSEAFTRDANRVPITGLGLVASKTITYAAGTTGAIAASDLFTVTGDVAVRIFAKCTSNLTSGGAPTIEVGISGNTAALIAQTAALDIDSGEIWLDAAPASVEALPVQSILVGGTDIIQTIASATVTGGVLTYYCLWQPISSDGLVIAS